MTEETRKMIYQLLASIIMIIFGLLFAFPLKWMWNYSIVYIFDLPIIGWGHAYCLWILSSWFFKANLINIKK